MSEKGPDRNREVAFNAHPSPQSPGEIWRESADGVMERLNEKGEVVERAKKRPIIGKDGTIHKSARKRGRPARTDLETHHFVLDGKGRKLWVPKGTNPDHLPGVIFPFSQVTCDHIMRHISEGLTLKSICAMEGIPPLHVVFRWLREYPEFKAQMSEAKKMRAEFRADRVMEIADQGAIAESDVPGERLRKDILQWGAEMDNRTEFGKQTKVVGDASQPIVFQINTGVPEAPAIEVKSTEVADVGSP